MTMQSHFAGARVLITGGLGFIGSNLARRLVDLGAQVALVDSLIPEYGGNLVQHRPASRTRSGSTSPTCATRTACVTSCRDQDFLFNLAGQTSHMDSMQDPFTDLEINCKAQLSILEACRKYNPGIRVVFASTRQIYGKPDYLPVDEAHLLRPVDVNGINKMAGEWYHILYNNVYGIRCCALRLTNTYGPRMRVKDARQTFLGIWIRLLIEGNAFEVWGGEQLRDFTYVDDAVEAMLLAAASETVWGTAFNLGGECAISLRDLAALLVEVNGSGQFVTRSYPADRKRIDIGDYYANYDRLQAATGWMPRVHLREGLTRTLEFYRRHLPDYL